MEACRRPEARVWIDLRITETGELEAWLDRLNVTGLTRRLCLEARDRPAYYPLRDEIFLVIPILADSEVEREIDSLAFLCRETLLLTVHAKPVMRLQEFDTTEGSDTWLSERSIARLVSAVMIDLSLECLRHISDLRHAIAALEERMDRESYTVKSKDILDRRSDLLALGAVVSDQRPCLQALSETDKSFFKQEDAREYMICALANLQAGGGSLDWMDGHINALRAGFEMRAQEKTNRRLNMLTVLSAIFNPAALLAGIWGMNFVNMPELNYPFAYPLAIALMVMLGGGMFLFFRRNGWFD
jgi:magnesium transporter